jgi:hypothetical protein
MACRVPSRSGRSVFGFPDIPFLPGPGRLLHFGTAYKLGPLHQIDLHFGTGLSRAAVDHFVGVGYSSRFKARK